MIIMDYCVSSGKGKCVYYCTKCREAGKEHEIIEVPAEPTEYGVPTHFNRCTGCGDQTGPRVKAKDYWSGGWI